MCLLTLMSFSVQSQDLKGTIMYDPLFWQEQLNLKRDQQHQIQAINSKFFIELLSMDCEGNGQDCKSFLTSKIHDRSNEIWSVFSARQKRTFKRIIQAYHQELPDKKRSG